MRPLRYNLGMITRRSPALILNLLTSLTVASIQLHAASGEIVVIDVPGAAGTTCTGINHSGQITGFYSDQANKQYGFLRDVNGRFSFFSESGAESTTPYGINDNGVVAGTVYDATGFHGFIREPSGQVTKFGSGGERNTFSEAINNSGQIAGQTGAFNVTTSFIGTPLGTLTLFSVPGSVCGTLESTGASGCTFATAINSFDQVAGNSYDANSQPGPYGFVRNADGTIVVFSAPNANQQDGTSATGIDDQGLITGYFGNQVSSLIQGYTRDANGNFAMFTVTDPNTQQPDATFPAAISRNGLITGLYTDAVGSSHGFIRDQSGNIATFDAPGAGTNAGLGTSPASINNARIVAGSFTDSSGVSHGFVRN